MEEEKVRKIAEIREMLEERAKTLEAELEGIRTLLDFVNDFLLEKSFRRAAEIPKPGAPKPEPQPPPGKKVTVIQLKSVTDEHLADLQLEDRSMRIIIAPDKKFNVNTPPFTAFLIERILAKMQEVDQEQVRQGKLEQNEAFSYEIKKDGDIILEMTFRNYGAQRERELRSATRWTLEKMHEKTRNP